jgi:hypothetical protein
MSLDFSLIETSPHEVFSLNITHNLGEMAGLYQPLWRPEELGIERAEGLVPLLREGLARLLDDPERFRAMNPGNGWGTYEGLVSFTERCIDACLSHPDALPRTWR